MLSFDRFPRFKPLFSAADSFLREVPTVTRRGPHIRDAIDLKRWMILVVLSLLPCILTAIWNAGMQSLVYGSSDVELFKAYLQASSSWSQYWTFASLHWKKVLWEGSLIFLPLLLISYGVGGFWEALFACVRKHEIAEGFLVSGILYPLILPPTIPYWMAALGISVGIILSKELFGGTGMNILNPALTCRCFLYFAFPTAMTGEIWAGRHASQIKQSLLQMNQQSGLSGIDGFSQPTALAIFNVSNDIKRIHVDAIAANNLQQPVGTAQLIEGQLQKWNAVTQSDLVLGHLNAEQLQQFSMAPFEQGGLGLTADGFQAATQFTQLKYGLHLFQDANLFFGNKLGSLGEVSIFACLLGALFLIITGIGSWRTMLAVLLGAFGTACLFEWGSQCIGPLGGAWNPANFDFPAYKHFLIGGLAFGLVFMATDPVSSPAMKGAKWAYGILIGMLTIVIRAVNPAYPEGVMLAILFGNVFAPLFDFLALRFYRRRRSPACV